MAHMLRAYCVIKKYLTPTTRLSSVKARRKKN
uniref:Uncharacterized protein n=1 Tax=Arundo donax TaxID=35708 RepID=A0A0A9BVK2_ARUDO